MTESVPTLLTTVLGKQDKQASTEMDRGAWWATFHGFARVGHDLATKPN